LLSKALLSLITSLDLLSKALLLLSLITSLALLSKALLS